jgi:two-component system, NtrC family, sensor kinase
LAKLLKFEKSILEAEGVLSELLLVTGNYPLALDHGFKAVSLAKKLNSPALGYSYAMVAYSYYFMGEYATCLKYTREVLKISQGWELPIAWRDLSVVYHRLNQPDSAMIYAKKAYEKLKGTESEAKLYNVLGDAYAGKALYDSALLLFRNGVTASLKDPSVIYLIDNYIGLAGVYKAIGNADSAIWYSKKALAEKIEKKYPIGLLKAADLLASVYESQNNPDSTLKYLRIALAVKDTLFSKEKTMAIQNLAFKEQEKQKEIEASKLQLQNQIKLYALLGSFFIVLTIAGLLVRNNRQKQKAKIKIEKAYGELKATQAQLVQSEKMASLGELTAGIAHEIQNPLNFVNNFSETNTELLKEAEAEFKSGNPDDGFSILHDIKENNTKINHHGRRADSIVKGMLEHSRTNRGEKQSTDINTLVDEYLRLSYHGFRAKDKSFNATIETNFDERIVKVNIIPQDIGRVLLNLFNNAFYIVSEKKKQFGEGYEPKVEVSSKRQSDRIEITVKDNGNGIPPEAINKIFQPFFTTKPTGQGTGLGLSLSYDIVKAHGGELKVNSKEGEGAEFTVQLHY